MKRVERVNCLLKKELSQIILKEVDFPKEVLVTVTGVETSIDLRQAKVYISVFPEKLSSSIINTLNRLVYHIQQRLNQRLKMRPVPKIRFSEEGGIKAADQVYRLLKEIHQKNG